MSELTFAFLIAPGPLAQQGLLLARSIRAFGGAWANAPIVTAVPTTARPLDPAVRTALDKLHVTQHAFTVAEEVRQFPFATKVFAAAEVEAAADTAVLTWMDTDSLLLNPPKPLLPAQGKQLGYRPVDHTLIGSRWDQSISPFWQQIYADCNVDSGKLWPIMTSVDEVQIRPYFNAGMLVVRPEIGLLQAWRDDFNRLFRQPAYTPFYQQDTRYTIFMHQAVLAGTLLRRLRQPQTTQLSHRINYPLHMHTIYPQPRRVDRLNDLISCRYDTLADDPEWYGRFPMSDSLQHWLHVHT